jgi:hypothetical protein
MSWLYSRALVEAYSAGTCLDGGLSAPSRSTPTPLGYLWRDKTTDAWRRFPSGMTFEPLTEDRGAAVLMSYLAAFPVRTSASQEKVPELTVNDLDCGAKWRESSARYDRASSSWKTHRSLFAEALPESSVTFPRWGMLRLGALWERQTSARRIIDNASGSLASMKQKIEPYGSNVLVAMSGGATCTNSTHTTATAQASKIGTGTSTRTSPPVEKWPTPAARDYRFPNKKTYRDRKGCKKGEQLPNAVGGPLNPTWAEWLMGWPLGWTDCAPLGMDRYQAWRRSLGDY